jgi:hypothetical protein
MKIILTIFLVTLACQTFAQTPPEAVLLKLSNKIFKWETDDQTDSLEKTFAPKFVVVSSNGEIQSKKEYITRLRSGNFVHNDIQVEQGTAVISGNTGTVIGKGIFNVTINGKQSSIHLAYLEVFTRSSLNKAWTLLALHASIIPD